MIFILLCLSTRSNFWVLHVWGYRGEHRTNTDKKLLIVSKLHFSWEVGPSTYLNGNGGPRGQGWDWIKLTHLNQDHKPEDVFPRCQAAYVVAHATQGQCSVLLSGFIGHWRMRLSLESWASTASQGLPPDPHCRQWHPTALGEWAIWGPRSPGERLSQALTFPVPPGPYRHLEVTHVFM